MSTQSAKITLTSLRPLIRSLPPSPLSGEAVQLSEALEAIAEKALSPSVAPATAAAASNSSMEALKVAGHQRRITQMRDSIGRLKSGNAMGLVSRLVAVSGFITGYDEGVSQYRSLACLIILDKDEQFVTLTSAHPLIHSFFFPSSPSPLPLIPLIFFCPFPESSPLLLLLLLTFAVRFTPIPSSALSPTLIYKLTSLPSPRQYPLTNRILTPPNDPHYYTRFRNGVRNAEQGIARPWWRIFFDMKGKE
uniref:Uncharacterized protein n=1 Tax=Kwoniella bestiolae CBS 10118 TaxID=1296100 RepID=A0A1B9G8V2_9TREE|nr:hypothetical protein I302_02316 [Kwoniella bestiolae CBS 10118]OCF27474.1 hypothetical protein I302_02316 [Kwoniella bestiolae CBS 10118]